MIEIIELCKICICIDGQIANMDQLWYIEYKRYIPPILLYIYFSFLTTGCPITNVDKISMSFFSKKTSTKRFIFTIKQFI